MLGKADVAYKAICWYDSGHTAQKNEQQVQMHWKLSLVLK